MTRGLLLVFAFSLAWLTADAATLPMPIANSINATATGKPDGPAPGWSIATSAPTGWTADCCKYAKAIGVDLVLYRGDWTGNPAQVMVLNVWPRKLPSLDAEVKADHAHYLKGDPRGSVSEFPVATKNLACRGVQYEGSDRIDDVVVFCEPSRASGIRLSWSMTLKADDVERPALTALFKHVIEASVYARQSGPSAIAAGKAASH